MKAFSFRERKPFRKKKSLDNIINRKDEVRRRETVGFSSSKGGGHPIYILLSLLGILIGIFLVLTGLDGNTLDPTIILIVGIFVVIKELLDLIH